MRKIEVDYNYLFAFTRSMKVDCPERWEDLNERQFKACAMMHVQPLSDVGFVSEFFGITRKIVKQFSKYEMYKLTELTSFALNPTGSVDFFYVESITGTSLLAPRAKLSNITIEHFALFDTYFFEYANTPTPENLCRFVATLYLKWRENITEVDFEERMKYVAKHVDAASQYAIFMNYIFLRKWLSKACRFLFQEADDGIETQSNRKFVKPTKPNRPDWNGIIDGLVGEDILHYEEYTQMKCMLAFKTINNRIKTYQKNGK